MPWRDREDSNSIHEGIRLLFETAFRLRQDLETEADQCGESPESHAARLTLDLLDERGMLAHPEPTKRVVIDSPDGPVDLTLPPIPANLVQPLKALARIASDANYCLWDKFGDEVRDLPENNPQRVTLEASNIVIQRWRDHLSLDVDDLLASVDA